MHITHRAVREVPRGGAFAGRGGGRVVKAVAETVWCWLCCRKFPCGEGRHDTEEALREGTGVSSGPDD